MHLGLYGLAGFFLRRRLFLAIVPALLLQRLLLQQGGWTTLGLNVMTTGSGALAGWLLASWPILPLRLRGFLAGFLGVVTGALATVAVLLAVGYDSRLAWLLYGYLLLGLVEGILTALALEAILRLRPGAFHRPEGAR